MKASYSIYLFSNEKRSCILLYHSLSIQPFVFMSFLVYKLMQYIVCACGWIDSQSMCHMILILTL